MAPRTPYILLSFANPLTVPAEYLKFLNREATNISGHLEKFVLEDHFDVQRLPNATTEDLFNTVEQWQAHKDLLLFHFGGHASGPVLMLNTEEGDTKIANGQGLARLLGSIPSLKLVFLNACDTEESVPLLLEAGVKAIIATDAPVQDAMALDFADRFYQNLANHQDIRTSFDRASMYLETKYHLKTSPPTSSGVYFETMMRKQQEEAATYRRIRPEKPEKEEKVIPWGLYYAEGHEKVLQWKIPNFSRQRADKEQKRRRSTALIGVIGAVLATVITLAVWRPWVAPTLDLTLSFYQDSTLTQFIETGTVDIQYGEAPEAAFSLQNGQLTLKDIPQEFSETELSIKPHFEGFSDRLQRLQIPSGGGALALFVPPLVYQTIVKGTLKNPQGQALAGATILYAGDTTETNTLGDFQFSLPFPEGTTKRMRVIYQQTEIYNGVEAIFPEISLTVDLQP
ncbi:MAG: CHAT domain-containing protein [Bacteroidota bacterium]